MRITERITGNKNFLKGLTKIPKEIFLWFVKLKTKSRFESFLTIFKLYIVNI